MRIAAAALALGCALLAAVPAAADRLQAQRASAGLQRRRQFVGLRAKVGQTIWLERKRTMVLGFRLVYACGALLSTAAGALITASFFIGIQGPRSLDLKG